MWNSPDVSWLLRFADQVMNKMRIGKDRKNGRIETTGRSWREPRRNLVRKIGSFASRKTQGIFVGHKDRTGTVLCIAKNGVVRGKSWTRQTQSDAWGATNWDGLCGTPWHMVALELKLTKKATADKEGSGTSIAKDCGGKISRR